MPATDDLDDVALAVAVIQLCLWACEAACSRILSSLKLSVPLTNGPFPQQFLVAMFFAYAAEHNIRLLVMLEPVSGFPLIVEFPLRVEFSHAFLSIIVARCGFPLVV